MQEKTITSNEDLCKALETIREDRGLSRTALATKRTQTEGRQTTAVHVRRIEEPSSSPTARVLIDHLKALGAEIILRW